LNTRKFLLRASALAVTGALTIVLPATADAGPIPAAAPAGYRVALGQIVTVADGMQGRSTAHCPKGTVPLGGGVFVNAVSLTAGVNSSFPTANGWTAIVNNESGQSGSMLVAVACANKPAHYSVVTSKLVANPSEHRTTVTVSCPSSAKPLGGGSQSTGGPFVALGGSRPFHNGWRITEENPLASLTVGGMSGPTVKAFAICGSVAGYRVVTSKPQTVLPLSQATLTASCPAGNVVLGGGASINTNVFGVNFNLTAPIDPTALSRRNVSTAMSPFAWQTVVNNNNEVNASASPFAICAGH
jgi:hypothetical protein